MSTAADLWLDELTDAAELDGDVIHAAVTIDLDIDSIVTITRGLVGGERPQGIAVDADEPFLVAGERFSSVVLWSDTAPATVELRVGAGRLSIWNVWRTDGAIHAWTGSAGMRRLELDDHDSDFGIRLLARDGYDGDDVDLEFEVRINGDRSR